MTTRSDGRESTSGNPSPPRCELWTWTNGKHARCERPATVVSHPAGFPRVVLNTCAKCDEHRKKEGLI